MKATIRHSHTSPMLDTALCYTLEKLYGCDDYFNTSTLLSHENHWSFSPTIKALLLLLAALNFTQGLSIFIFNITSLETKSLSATSRSASSLRPTKQQISLQSCLVQRDSGTFVKDFGLRASLANI